MSGDANNGERTLFRALICSALVAALVAALTSTLITMYLTKQEDRLSADYGLQLELTRQRQMLAQSEEQRQALQERALRNLQRQGPAGELPLLTDPVPDSEPQNYRQ